MGFFDDIKVDNDVVASEENVSSGGSYIKDTGTYEMIVKMAKAIESKGGAKGISIELETEDGKKLNTTEYVTTKEGVPYYIKKDGSKNEMIGFAKMKRLNQLFNGVIGMPSTEERVILERDWDTKKDIEVKRDVILSWVGKVVGVCVRKTLEDKYNDETNSVEKGIIEHFYDAEDRRFASEKPDSQPVLLDKFIKSIETKPVVDRRKNSKGAVSSIESANVATKPSVGF